MARDSEGGVVRAYTGKAARVARMVYLLALSRFARRSVLSGTVGGAVVSMATYGRRSATAHLAVESIARGSVRPSRFIVTIDGGSLDTVPAGLRRAARRGLEVRVARGYGPHTKYYPYLSEAAHDLDHPLVTADDDVFYPSHWLKKLLAAHEGNALRVVCWRARRFGVAGGAAAPYASWQEQGGAGCGHHIVPIGVAGVLYPPALQHELRRRGATFLDLVPLADDLWLHWVALRAGFPACRVVGKDDFALIPFTQAGSLQVENVEGGRNDEYVSRLYSPADLALIAAAQTP